MIFVWHDMSVIPNILYVQQTNESRILKVRTIFTILSHETGSLT